MHKEIMAQNYFIVLIIISSILFTLHDFEQLSYAEELSRESATMKYDLKLNQTVNEQLLPLKQIDIGIRAQDVICFDNKVLILKWSATINVACVNQDTAVKLQMRDWGTVKVDESKFTKEPPRGVSQLQWKVYFNNDIDYDMTNLDTTLIKHMRKSIHSFAEHTAWMPIKISDKKSDNMLVTTGAANINEEKMQIIMKDMEKNPYVTKIEFNSKITS